MYEIVCDFDALKELAPAELIQDLREQALKQDDLVFRRSSQLSGVNRSLLAHSSIDSLGPIQRKKWESSPYEHHRIIWKWIQEQLKSRGMSSAEVWMAKSVSQLTDDANRRTWDRLYRVAKEKSDQQLTLSLIIRKPSSPNSQCLDFSSALFDDLREGEYCTLSQNEGEDFWSHHRDFRSIWRSFHFRKKYGMRPFRVADPCPDTPPDICEAIEKTWDRVFDLTPKERAINEKGFSCQFNYLLFEKLSWCDVIEVRVLRGQSGRRFKSDGVVQKKLDFDHPSISTHLEGDVLELGDHFTTRPLELWRGNREVTSVIFRYRGWCSHFSRKRNCTRVHLLAETLPPHSRLCSLPAQLSSDGQRTQIFRVQPRLQPISQDEERFILNANADTFFDLLGIRKLDLTGWVEQATAERATITLHPEWCLDREIESSTPVKWSAWVDYHPSAAEWLDTEIGKRLQRPIPAGGIKLFSAYLLEAERWGYRYSRAEAMTENLDDIPPGFFMITVILRRPTQQRVVDINRQFVVKIMKGKGIWISGEEAGEAKRALEGCEKSRWRWDEKPSPKSRIPCRKIRRRTTQSWSRIFEITPEDEKCFRQNPWTRGGKTTSLKQEMILFEKLHFRDIESICIHSR